MVKDNQKQESGLREIGMSLDDVVRRGARQVIQQAVEAELAQLLTSRIPAEDRARLAITVLDLAWPE